MYHQHQSIKSWAEDDRPREKLAQKGRLACSDAELLAILLGSGSARESALSLAQRILHQCQGDLLHLGKLSLQQLCTFKGVGLAKAVRLLAALELGNRKQAAHPEERQYIRSSKDAFSILQPLLGDLAHEEFYCLYLNARNAVLQVRRISSGGLNSTTADPRLIFAEALHCKATAIILAHNHPSGNLQASDADLQLTKNNAEAGKYLQIGVYDHLIIGHNSYLSLADEGLM